MLNKRKGIWYVDFIDGSGRRVRRSTKTTDKKLAQQLHDELKAKAWRERHLGEKPRRTWKEAVVRYLKETSYKRSHCTDVSRLRWLDQFLGKIHLDEINADGRPTGSCSRR